MRFDTISCVSGYTRLHNSSKNVTIFQLPAFTCYGKPFPPFEKNFRSTLSPVLRLFFDVSLPFNPFPPVLSTTTGCGRFLPWPPFFTVSDLFILTFVTFCGIFLKVKGYDEYMALNGLLRDGSAWWEDPAPLLSCIPLPSRRLEMAGRVHPLQCQWVAVHAPQPGWNRGI